MTDGSIRRTGPGRATLVAAHVATVATLVAVATWLRAGPLGPSSLWLDDSWVALVVRADGPAATAMVGMTAPGFAFLLKGWLGVVGFSELAAQALPFAFGVAGPALLYVVAVRFRLWPVAAAVGAALLATAPMHVAYATRVKHYTLEALLALAILAVTWWALGDPARARRWPLVAAAAAGATVMSGTLAVYAAAAAIAGAVALRPGGGANRAARRAGMLALGGYACFAGAWWWVVLRPALNPHLRGYWTDRYIEMGAGPDAALASLWRNLVSVFEGLSAAPPGATGLLVVAGVVALAARRPALAALLAGPLVVAVALAAFQVAPLGGGRTDVHLYPALALLAAAGVQAVWRIRWVGALTTAGIVAGLLAGAAVAEPYPSQDVRPLVAEVDQRAGSHDAIVVYPATVWAYALYTDHPVALATDRSQGWGFEPVVDDPRVIRLGRHRDEPRRYAPELDRIVDTHERVWLLASHWRDDLSAIDAHLAEVGLEETARWERPGARLSLFEDGDR